MGSKGRRALSIAVAAAAIAAAVAVGWRALAPANPEEEARRDAADRSTAVGEGIAASRPEGSGSRRTEASAAEAGEIPLPPFVLRGEVVTARGRPVEGARVSVPVHTNKKTVGARRERTDREGRFRMHGRGMWMDEIEVEMPGGPTYKRNEDPAWEFVSGDHDFGVIEVPEIVGLKGRVADEEGRAVANARIFVLPHDLDEEFEYRDGHRLEPRAATDVEGRFSIVGFDGEELKLGIDAEGFGPRQDSFACVA